MNRRPSSPSRIPIPVNCGKAAVVILVLFSILVSGCLSKQTNNGPASRSPILYQSPSNPNASSGDSITMRQLENGLTFIHKRNTSNRIVGICVAVLTGSVNETEQENGLTNLCLNVMRKGTLKRTAQQIDEEIEALGISVDESAGLDFSTWSMVATLDDLNPAFDLLTELLLEPAFPPKEIENERAQVLAAIRMQEDNKFSYTYKNFRRLLYSGHPYGRPVEGTPESVAALNREQMVQLHRNRMMPTNMIVSIVGDIEENEALDLVYKHLGGSYPLPERRLVAGKEFLPRGATEELKREAEQGYVCIGYPTCSVTSPDYPALRITSVILGEGMSARLFAILRDQQSLAYSVGTMHRIQRQQGHFLSYIGTKPETVDVASRGMLDQLERMKKEPVGEEELTRAKNYATGKYLMAHESNESQAYYLAFWQAMGMGVNFDAVYPETLDRVTARDILRVTNKYFMEPTIVVLRPTEPGSEDSASPSTAEPMQE